MLLVLVALAVVAALVGGRRAAGDRAVRRAGGDGAAVDASACRAWQLASVALAALEGVAGLWLSVEPNAPPGADDRRARRRRLRASLLRRGARARAARAARRARGGAPLLALAARRLRRERVARAARALDVVATTTQLGDWSRAVGGDAVDVHQILQPNTDPHDYEPRPDDVEAAAGAKLVFASGDGLDALDGQRDLERRRPAEVVDVGASVPVRLPGECDGRRGLALRPALVARPAQRRGRGRARSATRSPRPTPAARDATARNAAAYLRRAAGARRRHPRRASRSVPPAQRKLVTDHDAFGYFAAPLRHRGRRRGDPVADDAGAAVGRRRRRRSSRSIRREHVRAIFPESSLSPKLAERSRARPARAPDHTLYGDTLGPSGSPGATYLRWSRPTPTRWCAASPAGARSVPDRGRRDDARRGARPGGRLRRAAPCSRA